MRHAERDASPAMAIARIGRFRAFLPLLMLAFLSACNYPGAEAAGDRPDLDLATQVAATVAAQLTEVAIRLEQTQVPTATLFPPTLIPTSTPPPTLPPTQPPTILPTPIAPPCNWAAFVSDVTIPDGTVMAPKKEFVKTWRLKNIGSCSWTRDYDLVFANGTRMEGERAIAFGGTVRPGDTMDISVDLTAPNEPGKYVGYWSLRDAAGRSFGLGPKADGAFWVAIEVKRPAVLAYDFSQHYCDADWRSAGGLLPCPGAADDESGFVVLVKEPVLEGGRQENEPGLWTEPKAEEGAWVSGEFPAFEVKKGDEFRAVLACLSESPGCDVRFRLEYRLENGIVGSLKKWDERSDGKFQKVIVDLSELAGKKVEFILTVEARGSSDDNAALWLRPSIWR